MKNIKWVVLLFLIAYALGFFTAKEVYKCDPVTPISSDTTETDSTVIAWEYTEYSDTTVAAIITYEENSQEDGDDEAGTSGKIASTRIEHQSGDILEISYSYDSELFSVGYTPAPRPIRTNFITREIKIYIPVERKLWDKPKLLFGAGCVTGATVILLTAMALGG